MLAGVRSTRPRVRLCDPLRNVKYLAYHESGREAKVGVDLEDRVRIERIVYAEQILRKVPVQRVLHFFLKKKIMLQGRLLLFFQKKIKNILA